MGVRNLRGVTITNAALLAGLLVCGHPALYLLWVAAWFTTYSLVMRIRSIAEHGMVPDPSDDLRNTRTTLARWWERLLIAPNRVNYQLEHHIMMAVPHYPLPRLHRLLRERPAARHDPRPRRPRLQDPCPRRVRRSVDPRRGRHRGAGRGRGRRARQQRGLRPGGRLRAGADGGGPPPVRDQRLRSDAAHAA